MPTGASPKHPKCCLLVSMALGHSEALEPRHSLQHNLHRKAAHLGLPRPNQTSKPHVAIRQSIAGRCGQKTVELCGRALPMVATSAQRLVGVVAATWLATCCSARCSPCLEGVGAAHGQRGAGCGTGVGRSCSVATTTKMDPRPDAGAPGASACDRQRV